MSVSSPSRPDLVALPPRFKLDENLPRDAELLLRAAGHDVETVLSEGFGGAPDPPIVDACRREGRILVTLDLDFADIRLYPPSSTPGVWALRPHLQSAPVIVSLLRRAMQLLESEQTERTLWVIDDNRVRIRD